ncbi:hypothetical protein [Pseudomonas sp. CC120222-01a]
MAKALMDDAHLGMLKHH